MTKQQLEIALRVAAETFMHHVDICPLDLYGIKVRDDCEDVCENSPGFIVECWVKYFTQKANREIAGW